MTVPDASGIEAVLFDLDYTLLEHDQDPADMVASAFESVGVEPFCARDEMRAAAKRVAELRRQEALGDRWDDAADADFLTLTFRLAAERHDGDPALAPALADAYDAGVDNTAVSFRDGAEEALAAARDHGPVGLLTNGGRESHAVRLQALGIEDAFDALVFAGDLAESKPAAAPFRTALSTLSVAPGDALYVGDSFYHDVVGAKRAGLLAAWCPTGFSGDDEPEGYDHRPDYRFETLAELTDVLRS